MNQKYLKEELKKYGFLYLEGQIPERQARQILTVKKLTQRENLVFIPKKEVCFERILSKHTSLYKNNSQSRLEFHQFVQMHLKYR